MWPLTKWKVLTKEKLYSLSHYHGSYKQFHKITKNLERKGIIQGYRDFFSRKRCLFATELGNELILDGGVFTPNHHNLFHDARLSELIQELSLYDRVEEYHLEHTYRNVDSNEYNSKFNYYPDAVVSVDLDDKLIKVGIELEITQKSSSRIKAKLSKFRATPDLVHVIYFFTDETAWKKYIEIFKKKFKEEEKHKVFFIFNETILNGSMKLDESKIYFCGNFERKFKEFFGERLRGD